MSFHGTVTGNLGETPAVRFTKDGKATLNLNVAATPTRFNKQTNSWEDVGEPLWVRATLWEQTAEKLANALNKGDRVSLEGTLSLRPYDAKDGSRHVSYELIGAKFLGVIPRTPQNGTQWDAGAANMGSQAPTTSSDPWGAQNGTQPPF